MLLAAVLALATAGPVAAHEIRVGQTAASDPYAPYSFLVGDWNVGDASGGAAFVTLRFQWAHDKAYLKYGAYIGQEPHFEGVMMWNGAHHNLDALVAMDMEHGLVQERGSVSIIDGAAVRDSLATYSEGVSAGGPLAGPGGATSRTRQTMRPIDADHIALSFEIETPSGWKPAMPGGDHLLMTRAKT
nr:hypothetical protein [Polymorphobacter sp.]